MGAQGSVTGKQLLLGNTLLMSREKVDISALKPQAESLRAEGASVMYLAVDTTLAGILSVTDPITDSTAQALETLLPMGFPTCTATGDRTSVVKGKGVCVRVDLMGGRIM